MLRKRWKKRRRYPKNWKQLATECKHRAGWICEHCGEAHLTIKVSKRTGVLYPMRLHAAHDGRYTASPKLKRYALLAMQGEIINAESVRQRDDSNG